MRALLLGCRLVAFVFAGRGRSVRALDSGSQVRGVRKPPADLPRLFQGFLALLGFAAALALVLSSEVNLMTDEKLISQHQAARILKRSPRTVGRWAEDGTLTRNPANGKYLLSEVEELAESQEEEQAHNGESQVLTVLKEQNTQLMAHNEKLMQLVTAPLTAGVDLLKSSLITLTAREGERDKLQLETMAALGDFLLRKDERAAEQLVAQSRADQIAAWGKQLGQVLPALLAQKSVIHKLFSVLSPEEKSELSTVYWAFDSEEKRAAFGQVLAAAGIPIPPDPSGPPEAAAAPVDDEGASS
jgi:hypothetical protein